MALPDTELQKQLDERLKQLPQVVRDAIISSNVEQRLRALADTQKLHLDQWQILENEVMLTLLGFQQIENLEKNIKEEVGVSDEIAHTLATRANEIVFEPIRQELERQLEHPAAQEKEVSAVESTRDEVLKEVEEGAAGAEAPAAEAAPTIQPATPPPPPNETKVTRPSESTAYKPGEPSSARTATHDDPYRVPPV